MDSVKEDKNMEELTMAWDFLEKELENFQRIVSEMEEDQVTAQDRKDKVLSMSSTASSNYTPPVSPSSSSSAATALLLGAKPKPALKPKPKVPPSSAKPQLSPKPQTLPKPVFQTNL